MSKSCQSCGMPMGKCPEGGGTEADGSRSTEYCSFCYQQGQFTHPNISASEMQTFCIEKLKEHGVPKIFGWLMTRGIPKLKRWR